MQFDRLVRDALGSVEGPVARRDGVVVDQLDGAFEDVHGELIDPAVPVALVELLAVVWVPEEPGPHAHLRSQGVVSCSGHLF